MSPIYTVMLCQPEYSSPHDPSILGGKVGTFEGTIFSAKTQIPGNTFSFRLVLEIIK